MKYRRKAQLACADYLESELHNVVPELGEVQLSLFSSEKHSVLFIECDLLQVYVKSSEGWTQELSLQSVYSSEKHSVLFNLQRFESNACFYCCRCLIMVSCNLILKHSLL